MRGRLGMNRECRKSQGTIISGATLKFENNVKVYKSTFYSSGFTFPPSWPRLARGSLQREARWSRWLPPGPWFCKPFCHALQLWWTETREADTECRGREGGSKLYLWSILWAEYPENGVKFYSALTLCSPSVGRSDTETYQFWEHSSRTWLYLN